jgi:mediator of RNA polymerase II transcription subunit 7
MAQAGPASAPQAVHQFPLPPRQYYAHDSPLPATESPPSAPCPDESYAMFGRMYATTDRLPSLQECGRVRLYDDSPNVRASSELRRLNKLLLSLFRTLLVTLSTPTPASPHGSPPQHAVLVANIENVFINMHHLLNTLRPAQAVRDLRLLLEHQTEGRRAAARKLKEAMHVADDAIVDATAALGKGLSSQGQKSRNAKEVRAVEIIQGYLDSPREDEGSMQGVQERDDVLPQWYKPQKLPASPNFGIPRPPTPVAAATAKLEKLASSSDNVTLANIEQIIADQNL